jgi:transcriptional regulator with XRE-family HTH domain
MLTQIHELDQRRRQLGLSYAALAKRSGVSQATVVRLLSGRHPQASFQNVIAIAEALGYEVTFTPAASTSAMRKAQAMTKARRLVGLVQGTSGLEAQAVDAQQIEDLTEQTASQLLAGSPRRLWGD